MDEITKAWDYLIDHEIATEDELKLITSINGYNMEALNDVLYSRTGYRSIDQMDDNFNDDDDILDDGDLLFEIENRI